MNQYSARIRRATTLVAAGLLLASCGGGGGGGGESDEDASATPAKGGTLRIADTREATSLNPYIAIDGVSLKVFGQILEPLYRTDVDGKVIPWLVKSGEPSADDMTWTLELRDDVKFTDGAPMTADDVVYSIDEIRKNPAWKTMFAAIDTVKASGPATVVITTSIPAPALDVSLSLPFAPVVPKDLGGMSPEEFGKNPVGTGPFKLGSWVPGKQLTLVKNDAYWDPERPYLDEVVFLPVTGDSSRVQQLKAGDLDLIGEPPRPQIKALQQAPETEVGQYDLAFPSYLMLNQKSEAFSDPRIREAVDLAVDREAILKVATNGVGELGGSFLPPAVEKINRDLKTGEQDADQAKQVLAEAVADGADPTFKLTTTAGDSYQKLASQIIKQNLDDIGFDVVIEQLDGSAALSQVTAGKYDASLFKMTSDIVDPSELVGFYLDTDGVWTGGETKQVRGLFDQAEQEGDDAKRTALYDDIQKVVFDDRSLVVLNYQPWVWGRQSNVVGFDVPMTGIPWLADAGLRAE